MIEIQNCSSSFFFSQPGTLMRKVTKLKRPSTNFPRMVNLYLVWSETTVYIAIFHDLWAICYHAGHHLYWACFHPRNNGTSSRGCMGRANNLLQFQERSLHKKISKKKSSWYRDGSMNALADEVHKQGMLHSDMHSITQPQYSITIPT